MLQAGPRMRAVGVAAVLASVGSLAGCAGGSSPVSSSTVRTDRASQAVALAAGVTSNTFHEDFRFRGDHAFITGAGGDAVWWDQNVWDVRNDTANEAIERISESGRYQGNYTAIMKAKSPSNKESSAVVNSGTSSKGDGSPGVGLMQVDFQGIESARLRNPMLIGAGHTATVAFWAPLFVTTGHWWEIAITPTDQPYGGEYSAVPARQIPEALNDPTDGSSTGGGNTNGPGHRAVVEDSINVISTGFPDAPMCNNTGWHARWALTQATNGRVKDHVNPRGSIEKLKKVDPEEKDELYPWKVTYTPNEVKLWSDFNEDGKLTVVDHWKVNVAWNEVYVNFLDVGYQAGHHPQAKCGLHTHGIRQAQITAWRKIAVSPVKYARTFAVPGPTSIARRDGWLDYDLRDTDHIGSGQPNKKYYDKYGSYLYCSVDAHGGLPCPTGARKTVNLDVTITSAQLSGLRRAQFLGDVRHTGNVQITINGHSVGTLKGQPVRPDFQAPGGFIDPFEPDAWVRHGLNIPSGVLHAGVNHVVLHLDQSKDVDLDRLQIELSSG